MAGTKVRGITIELSADASGVNSALSQVNKSINSTSRELRDIDKLLKLDPSNVTLLAQKQEALERQITNTTQKIKLLREAEEDLNRQMVDGGTEEQKKQLNALQREIVSCEKYLEDYTSQMDSAGKETDQLTDSERDATGATSKMGDGFTVLKGVLSNLVTDGIRMATDALKDLVTEAPAYADEILTLASTTGLATDTLQELSYMSGLVDVDVNTVAQSMRRLVKNMGTAQSGTGNAAKAFESLGVSITDSNGNLRDSEDVFFDTIDALGKIENETERDATAMDLFGKSATDLNPMIEAGGEALKGFTDEAHEMGAVLDDESLTSLGAVQDSFDRFDQQMIAVKNTVGASLAPALERAMKKVQQTVDRIDWNKIGDAIGKAFDGIIEAFDWIIKHGKTVKTVIAGIVIAMAASKINAAVSAFKALATTLKSVAASAAANPYLLMIGAIVAAGAALITWQKSLFDAERAADKSWQTTDRLTEAASEQVAVVNDMVKAYDDAATAREEALSAQMEELSHVESLKSELDNLANANGVVAESDKTRAQFILNELNSALGTEYTMTGNVINQYKDLKTAIDEVIAKKKSEIILSAQEDAYREAITKRADAERALTDVISQENEIKAKMADNEARIQELLSATGPQLAANAKEAGNLKLQNLELGGSLDELGTKHAEAAELVNKYAYDISTYEDNMAKSIEGNYEDIKYESYETAKAMGRDMDDYAKKVEEDANAAAREFSTLSGRMKAAAKNIGQGVADGINAGAGPAYTAMSAFGNNLLTKFNKTMEIESPSKVMEQAAKYMVQGVTVGIDENERQAVNRMKTFSSRLIDVMNPLVSGYNGNYGSAGTTGTSVSNTNFTQNIYAPQQPSRIELYRQTRNLLALRSEA